MRELQSCIEYMYALSEGHLLDVQHLPQHIWESVKGNQNAIGECREETPALSLKKEASSKANLKEVVEQVEKEMIIKDRSFEERIFLSFCFPVVFSFFCFSTK
ncbi:hypothetical protein JQC72_08175 [Polycladomyces sp. WAk]|uniref:Uncharacterized protein n=1 Tax=Polycladomyces zharkentensis TaxID=2807616 RepID=A0ABS2WJ67_9BACL|nr:hypothetical protein [Polycladomyces sp. WAk]MBN2909501.1 hypothetical protein [Polycladomyces sp. WAk]